MKGPQRKSSNDNVLPCIKKYMYKYDQLIEEKKMWNKCP